jgi:hypothetical protein
MSTSIRCFNPWVRTSLFVLGVAFAALAHAGAGTGVRKDQEVRMAAGPVDPEQAARCHGEDAQVKREEHQLTGGASLFLRMQLYCPEKSRISLFYSKKGKEILVISRTGYEVQWSTIEDFNGDGKPEFIFRENCGGSHRGCDHTIYLIDLNEKTVTKVIRYWGVGAVNRYGDYLVILTSATAKDHYYLLFKIIDFDNLQFGATPLRLASTYDHKKSRYACQLPFKAEHRSNSVVKKIIKENCQEGAIIKTGSSDF